MTDFTPDVLSEPPDEPVVHWMQRPPSSIGPAGMAGALFGAFVLGALATAAAVAVMRMMDGDDEAVLLRRIG